MFGTVIGEGKNLLNDSCSLEESEFGRLVTVVDALNILSFCFSPHQTQQVIILLYKLQIDHYIISYDQIGSAVVF